ARTGVVRGERGGGAEVAVPGVAAGGLVELVHGVGGVGAHRVGLEARATGLDGAAVHAHLRARVVQVGLQVRLRRAGARHAPPAAAAPRLLLRCPAVARARRAAGRRRQAGVVRHGEVGVVQPERALRRRAGLEVLVVEREQVRVHGLARHQRRAGAGPQVGDEVGDVGPGVVRRGAGL
ncbi:Os03g0669450, partial [Oryza sativa Japonica Group]